MQRRRVGTSLGAQDRRGLAPVELILSLPIWLLLAAAMVQVGHLAVWKIRGHLAVREAAARVMWPRTRAGEPNSDEWTRPSAVMQTIVPISASQTDPLAPHAVIRGPQVGIPQSGVSVPVDARVMDVRSGVVVGEAFQNEPPALWPRSGIRNKYHREFCILDGNCGQWGDGAGVSTLPLRASLLWTLPPLD